MTKFNMADLNEESREVGFDAKREAIEYWSKEENGIEDEVPTESPNDISVKVTADVSEAITGFKALQREIRETTKAIREYEEAVEGVPFHLDKDGNLSIVGAEIRINGETVSKAVEPAVNEAQARKESFKRRF